MLSSTDAKVLKVKRALGAGDTAEGRGVSNCGGTVKAGVELGNSVDVGSRVGVGEMIPVAAGVGVGVDEGRRVGVGVSDGGMGVGVLITATGGTAGGAG